MTLVVPLKKIWWWLRNYSVCYANCPHNGRAWCKRRPGHLGDHRTGSGFSWKKKEHRRG